MTTFLLLFSPGQIKDIVGKVCNGNIEWRGEERGSFSWAAKDVEKLMDQWDQARGSLGIVDITRTDQRPQ